jgi:hypothetical protein
MLQTHYCSYLLVAFTVCLAGCGSRPSRVDQPRIDATEAGRLAMERYDENGDGKVAGDELASAPGLNAALSTLDTDGDGGVSAEEVTARVESWQSSRAGVMSIQCQVLRGGQPLTGALVTFEPEEFLGDDILNATGEVTRTGRAMISIPKESRPHADYPAGVQMGLYKVKITMPNNPQAIPPRYNTETIFGQEVSYDDPAIANHRVRFELE